MIARIATRNHADALDIVQDAMLQLIRRYSERASAEWAPLFQQILQRRILDWYRRERVRNRFRVWFGGDDSDGDPLENLPGRDAAEPTAQAASARSLTAIEAALQRLPLRQQQAFLLRTAEGLDVAQTAHAMGCSPGSVKTHYSRAVHALREQLEGHEP